MKVCKRQKGARISNKTTLLASKSCYSLKDGKKKHEKTGDGVK